MDVDNQRQHQPPKRVEVCGGGIVGVCTAYFLAKQVVFWHFICATVPLSPMAHASFDLHRSLAQELDGSRSYGYRPLTAVTISIDDSEPPPESPILPPWVDGGVKAGEIIGTTETTAQIHPQLFTRALLAKAVSDYGVEVVIAKVESVEVEEEGVAVKVDGGGVIGGDAVVLALGPWTSKLPEVSSRLRVYGKKVHSVVLEPRDGGVITPHALFGTYYPAQEVGPIDPERFIYVDRP